MKKIGYKLFIAFIFSVFGTLVKLLFVKSDVPIDKLFISEDFWFNFLILFSIGYVLLGNMLWANAHNNKKKEN